ncbi:MAG: response regulator [Chthoniobacteraceae bacterium]
MTHHLTGNRVTIGRAPDNTIQIAHGSVSSHHAEIVEVNGHYCLHDLHSTNRSYVEGKPIAEFDLSSACKILLGSVECEFDPLTVAPTRRPALLPAPEPARPDLNFLESENRDLRERVHSLQRRFDILGSARLVTGRSDLTPYATADDAMKSLTRERDELRQQSAGLRLQVEHLREELTVTARERDAARRAAEALQAEKTVLQVELKQALARAEKLQAAIPPPAPPVAPPPKPPTVAPVAPPPPPAGVTPKAPTLPAPDPELIPEQVRVLREVIAQLSAAPAERALLSRASEVVTQVSRNASTLGNHAVRRLSRDLRDFIHDLGRRPEPPETLPLRTARHAVEFLTHLLEPELFARGRDLPPGQVLLIDDDTDLLSTVATTLTGVGLHTTGCESAEAAVIAIEAQRFDAIVADVCLPEMNGPAFCAHARDLPAYRRTPIIFLTVADTLDKRAETSLSGGSDFIAKPFNVYELALKVETWALKQQLQLL